MFWAGFEKNAARRLSEWIRENRPILRNLNLEKITTRNGKEWRFTKASPLSPKAEKLVLKAKEVFSPFNPSYQKPYGTLESWDIKEKADELKKLRRKRISNESKGTPGGYLAWDARHNGPLKVKDGVQKISKKAPSRSDIAATKPSVEVTTSDSVEKFLQRGGEVKKFQLGGSVGTSDERLEMLEKKFGPTEARRKLRLEVAHGNGPYWIKKL